MTTEEKKERQIKFNNISYYLIIGLVSIIVTGFVPMLSSEVGLEWKLPNTTAGWSVWIISKLSIALVNMLLFYCFMQQAKVNIKDDVKYLKAKEILHKAYKCKKITPKSPREWTSKQYLSKGTTLFLSSILSTVGLTQAILTFNVVEFLSLSFTIIIGVVFGYLQMKRAEDYWTTEFYEYALMVEDEYKQIQADTSENQVKAEELVEEEK